MRPVILTCAHDFTWPQLRPFIVSLCRSGYDGDVVVFASDINRAAVHGLEEYNCWVQPYDKKFPYLPEYMHPGDLLSRWTFGQMISVCYRFLLYHCFLERYGNSWDTVFMTDSRDVVFQDQPFPPMPIDKILAFTESPRMTLGSCPYNSKWMQQWFPDEKHKYEPIICAGTTFGPMGLIKRYLEQMLSHLSVLNPGQTTGCDQAIHNVMLWNRALPVHIYGAENAIVRTVGYDIYPQNNGRRVTNDNGVQVRIVHQWDRHPFLTDLLRDLWE